MSRFFRGSLPESGLRSFASFASSLKFLFSFLCRKLSTRTIECYIWCCRAVRHPTIDSNCYTGNWEKAETLGETESKIAE